MAILALNTSAYRNAVSRLHREVSQEMWHELWPTLPVWETPITSVTNGVHLPSWLNGDLADLYDQYLEPDWRDRWNDPTMWKLVDDIPDEELLEVHRRRKRRLIAFVRERQTRLGVRGARPPPPKLRYSAEVLDPHALTIGFARRFATYKRATLLFRDVDRLKKILCNRERPVQIVIAGKAHPKDQPGKAFIREIVQLSRDPELWKHIVFVEDYDMKVARELVQGVDLWLNNPRRGEEACGTSGMKAAMNGVLNLSVLDGWFDEAYEISGGWAIGDREPYSDDQDAHPRQQHLLPAGKRNRADVLRAVRRRPVFRMGAPHEGVHDEPDAALRCAPHGARVRRSSSTIPRTATGCEMAGGDFDEARQRAAWNARVREIWPQVSFVDMGPAPTGPVMSGKRCRSADRHPSGRSEAGGCARGVRDRAIGASGGLEETEVVVLPSRGVEGDVAVFEREIVPAQTGRLGYAVRVSPNHDDDPLTRPVTSLLKWGGR